MKRREHGGNSDQGAAHFGHDANDMLDLSTGISPRAYPTADVTAQSWNQLPSQSQLDTCLAAARRSVAIGPCAPLHQLQSQVAIPPCQKIYQMTVYAPHAEKLPRRQANH